MDIKFDLLDESYYAEFGQDIKEVFSIAITKEFGEDAPSNMDDKEIRQSLYKENAEVYAVYVDNNKVGGVVLIIDKLTQHNSVELFYLYPNSHSRGMGHFVWTQIEQRYPETKVWQLVTPYYEKRNINFYVNKCGFKIVEFFNSYHKYPDFIGTPREKDEFFRFEKEMSCEFRL